VNVGNSLQRGIGKHLAASYPYSAGIGVGVVAYFGCKGILRPAILKWASAPRFLFCLCCRGADRKIGPSYEIFFIFICIPILEWLFICARNSA
jgi:hypothetical protein